MKKRVCFVNYFLYNIYHPELGSVFGGAEIQLYYLIEALKQTNQYEIIVFGKAARNRPIIEKCEGITFWNVYKTANNKLFDTYYLLKQLWFFWKINADTYITRAASIEVGIVILFCNVFGKKSIHMTAHDIDVDGSFLKSSSMLIRYSYRYGLRKATTVLAQNQYHIDLLLQKQHIIAYQLPNSFQLPLVVELPKERKTNLWVGRAVDWKRPDRFIELAKHFPTESFTMIINEQDANVLDNIEQMASAFKNIHIIKNVAFSDINNYFKQAKLFINTSEAEGFPNTFIQAAMYSCPILSYNVNPDDMLTKHKIGWFADNNPKRLLQLFAEIIDDEEARLAYGKKARHYIEQHHDIKHNIKILEKYL